MRHWGQQFLTVLKLLFLCSSQSSCLAPSSTFHSTDMGSCWLMLLLLLIGDGALHLPGNFAVCGDTSPAHATHSSVSTRAMPCPSVSIALSHDLTSTDKPNGLSTTSKSQERTSASLPTSPPTSSSTGSTEQTAPKPETLETTPRITTSHTPHTAPSSDTAPSSPMSTSTRVTSRTTTSSSTAIPSAAKPTSEQGGATVGTAMTETRGETTIVPPASATTLVTSKPSAAQHSTTQQTSAPPAQPASAVGTSPVPAPLASKAASSTLASLGSPGSEKAVTITAPTALRASDNDMKPSESVITTVSEKSALTVDKVLDVKESLSTTTRAITHASSPNIATLGTRVLGITLLETAISKTQEGESTAVPPTQATVPSMSKPSDAQPSTTQQTLSPPMQSASKAGTDISQAPEPTSHHPTALVPSSSMTTKSSATAETGPVPPKSSWNSSPQAGDCALDEYTDSMGGCRCNQSYYAHSELSRELMTLHCWPQDIEVALRSCFLETHHWVLKQGAFKGCFSIKKIEQGRRVHSFRLEKKKGTCGLHLSTNISHALYSVEVQLEQVLPDSNINESRMLNFSCVYPLAVNVSQTLSNQVDSSPAIHIPSTGETIVTLSVFTDAQLSSSLKNRTALIGTPLYVVLKSTNSDPDRFALVANEVFASTNLSKTGVKATYHFVNDSCPVGGRLLQDLAGNGVSLQVTLAFTLQRFLNSDTLYLHARVSLCDKQQGRSCQPTCNEKNPLRRSSPWEIRTPDGVQHGGRGEWIVFGPLRISESRAGSGRSSAGAWMPIFLLMVIGQMLG